MARDTSKLVTIPGELHSAATGNIVAAAEEVFDYTINKYQKDINQEVAYIKEDSSIAPIPSFNPQSQTVHLDEQVLSNAQKKQVRKNIGLGNGDIDNTPTSGSDNVVRSGGVYSSMQELRSTVNPQVGYYTCSTEGNTAAKVIDASGYTLLKGGGLRVNFIEKNTAANATLNIEQTGAKPLYYNGVRVSTNNSWYAGEIMTLFYDGAAFQLNSLPDLDEYDVSARNGGQAFTFEEAVALVPDAYKHGGLKLRFISNSDSSTHTSDNKYVQYRLITQTFSTTVGDWQGVDVTPTIYSKSLIESGGVYNSLSRLENVASGIIRASNTTIFPFIIVQGRKYKITCSVYSTVTTKTNNSTSSTDGAVDTLGYCLAGSSIEFTATGDASFVRLWTESADPGTYSIEEYGTIIERLNNDESKLENLTTDTDRLNSDVYIIEESRNKFNKNDIIANSTINSSGTILPAPNNDRCVSNKIFFKSGDVLRCDDTVVHYVAFYYEDNTFELQQYGAPKTVQKNGYARYVVANSGINTFIVTENDKNLLYTPYYIRKVSKLSYFHYEKKISRNHFDKATITPNSTINSSGNVVSATDRFVTAMIWVNKGDVINHSSATVHYHAYYNAKGTFINLIQYGAYNEVVQQDGFIRFVVADADKDTFVLCVNNKDVSYCPYYEPFTIPMSLDEEIIVVGEGYNIRQALEQGKENGLKGIHTVVYVPEGTYNVMDLFTAEEINTAEYTQTGFVGLEVNDNVTLIGLGDKSKVILHGELSTSDYNADIRTAISTLNLKGKVRLENLTVESVNLRYPIHDDFNANKGKVHDIVNCVFNNITPASQSANNGYGLGTKSGSVVNIKDCTILPNMVYHDNVSFTSKSVVNIYSSYISNVLSVWSFGNLLSELNLYNVSYGSISIDGTNIAVNDYIHGVNNVQKSIIQQFEGKTLTFNQDGTITWSELT